MYLIIGAGVIWSTATAGNGKNTSQTENNIYCIIDGENI